MEIDISSKVKKTVQLGMLAVLVLTVVTSCGVWLWQSRANHIPVKTAQVEGTKVNVSIKANGTVQELLVEDGAVVQAGQKLARLNVAVTPEEIASLEEALAKARERYQQILTNPPAVQQIAVTAVSDNSAAKAAYDKAAANKARMEQLYAIGGISKRQYEQAEAEFNSASAAYEASAAVPKFVQSMTPAASSEQMLKTADLQVRQAEMALAGVKSKEQAAEVIAPIDGIVQLGDFNLGDEVKAGQALFFIRSEMDSWIEAQISADDRNAIILGEFVKYNVADFPEETFSGTIFDIIDNEIDTTLPDDIVKVKISAPLDSEVVLYPGMQVNLKLKRI